MRGHLVSLANAVGVGVTILAAALAVLCVIGYLTLL